jgi:hypothetical protein
VLVYLWLYEGWLDDDSGPPPGQDPELLKLSRNQERMRWRFAGFAILIVLAEMLLGRVHSWGIYAALLMLGGMYVSTPYLTTRLGGEIELSPRQQSTRRRWTIVPVMLVLFRGTDFETGGIHAYVLVTAGLAFAMLILMPEPAE